MMAPQLQQQPYTSNAKVLANVQEESAQKPNLGGTGLTSRSAPSENDNPSSAHENSFPAVAEGFSKNLKDKLAGGLSQAMSNAQGDKLKHLSTVCASTTTGMTRLEKKFDSLEVKYCTRNEYNGLMKDFNAARDALDALEQWKAGLTEMLSSFTNNAVELKGFGETTKGLEMRIKKAEALSSKAESR